MGSTPVKRHLKPLRHVLQPRICHIDDGALSSRPVPLPQHCTPPSRSSGSQVRDPPSALGQPFAGRLLSSQYSTLHAGASQHGKPSLPSYATLARRLPETAFPLLRSSPSPLHYPLAEVADIRRGERVQIPLPVPAWKLGGGGRASRLREPATWDFALGFLQRRVTRCNWPSAYHHKSYARRVRLRMTHRQEVGAQVVKSQRARLKVAVDMPNFCIGHKAGPKPSDGTTISCTYLFIQ